MNSIFHKYLKYFFIFLSLVIVVITIFNLRFTSTPELIASTECRCSKSEIDPYDFGLKFTSGRFKGMCLDSCSSRPIFSKDTFKNSEPSFSSLKLNNIYHDKKFWALDVPLDELESVDVVFLNFTWKINHVSLKFHFKKDSRLVLHAQTDTANSENKNSHHIGQSVELKEKSILISPDPSLPINQKFNLLDGMLGSYSLIFKAYSAEEFFNNSARFDHKVKYLKTKLNPQESTGLFMATVARGSNKEFGNYQLLFNNCATTTIDLILNSKNLDQKTKVALWAWMDPMRGVPSNLNFGTKRTLKSMDLIDTN